MEVPKELVIGYPVDMCQAQSNHQLPNYHPHQPTLPPATANMNTTNANIEQPPPPTKCTKTSQDQLAWKNCLAYLSSVVGISLLVFLLLPLDEPLRDVEFHLKSLTVSPSNVSDSQITTNWNITFFVRNPNRMTIISYEMIQVSLFHKEDLLSTAIISSFTQQPKNETVVHVDNWTRKAFFSNIVKHRVVDFNIKVETMARFDDLETGEGEVRVRVSCDNVRVEFSSNGDVGSMLGEDQFCKTHVGKVLYEEELIH